MFEVAYLLFFFILCLEVVLFLFLNLPTPRGWKSVVVRFINTNPHVATIIRAHIGLCIIAGVFYFNCYHEESRYRHEKDHVRDKDSYAAGKDEPT
jgi:hypothetical protein